MRNLFFKTARRTLWSIFSSPSQQITIEEGLAEPKKYLEKLVFSMCGLSGFINKKAGDISSGFLFITCFRFIA